MAFASTALNPYKHGFIFNAVTDDASGCEALVAAPAAGISLYLERLTISSNAAITITIGAGETAGAVTTALLGPLTFGIGTTIQWEFDRPIKVGAATALTVDASGAGAFVAVGQGFVA